MWSNVPALKYFRYFLVGIRCYISVSLQILNTDVGIELSVFENIAISIRYRYYRPMRRLHAYTVADCQVGVRVHLEIPWPEQRHYTNYDIAGYLIYCF